MLRITDKETRQQSNAGFGHSHTRRATARADKAGNQNEHGAVNEGRGGLRLLLAKRRSSNSIITNNVRHLPKHVAYAPWINIK